MGPGSDKQPGWLDAVILECFLALLNFLPPELSTPKEQCSWLRDEIVHQDGVGLI